MPSEPGQSEDVGDALREWVNDARRLVVKIGSRVLVDDRHRLDVVQLRELVDQMADLRRSGREIVCVSSGAIATGVLDLGLKGRPRDLPSLQASAAIGQARLIGLYREFFAAHGLTIGQVLLTHADLRERERHLNARNTLSHLLEQGAVPIINENDTVAVDEIRVGDNDQLSALVACLVRADVLVMLTSVDGLLTRPPDEEGASLVREVERVTAEIESMAGAAGSSVATGGMRSKIEAARMVMRAGERVIIANGRTPNVLRRLFRKGGGEVLGTAFHPRPRRLPGRKCWIAFFDHPRGDVHVDAGAVEALQCAGGSLLAVGIERVEGNFERGAPVRILDPDGTEIGRGLVNFPSEDLTRIVGLRSDQIGDVLGASEYKEVVHRDNLWVR